MLHRKTARILIGAGALALSMTAAPAAHAAPTTLYYDDSLAAEFKSAVAAGAAAWNSSVQNVRLVKAPAGRRAEIQIIADNGWPRATLGPVRPGGRVTIWFGRQAVAEGYNTTRIAAHELGHSLGLPDRKPGPCSSLMSGSTGGVSCTNALPNTSERAAVERNYAGTAVTTGTGRILVDAP
ncbi:snapalysin family zinc-dependent metalloprotease [Thermomonospora cellulosilytica]|uniref:Extracellular small neutral protease n=1 Tax=Thermomonospora cellulosilytica TaxID=1411118 RepID=A0A7W3N2W1_9ACTN|nr:snapalysin family zinc-dependent metalloprotease [Thermomonospora cellulosilytica]MBA9006535.1 snapalysin [Thermomonospora cellulosilytica]